MLVSLVFVIWYSGLLNLVYENDLQDVRAAWYTWGLFGVAAVLASASSVWAVIVLWRVRCAERPQLSGPAPGAVAAGETDRVVIARGIAIVIFTLCLLWFPVVRVQERLVGVGFPGINFLLPMVAVAVVVCILGWRDASGWLNAGRYDGATWGVTGLVIVLSAAALVAWSELDAPTIYEQATQLLFVPRDFWIPAAIGFAVTNATVEEVLFRGAIWQGLRSQLPLWATIGITSVLFAILHLFGFPSGPIGMMMVFVWGIALGFLRERTRGMLAPIVAHVGADLAIFAVLATRL